MRRKRRKRSTRRRGLQHIGDVLSTILTDLDEDETQEQGDSTSRSENTAVPISATSVDPQNTFSFYQPAEA